MKDSRIVILVFLSALVLWTSACSDAPQTPGEAAPEVACETSADCEGGLCLLDICRACLDDAACAQDDLYGAGAICKVSGQCESCFGEEDCACGEGDVCEDGLRCEDGVCAECPVASEGCECLSNGTCLDGLRCEEAVCVVCPPGEEGCPCDAGACGPDLGCREDLCVPLNCQGGELDCPCLEDGEEARCDDGLTCSDAEICAECADGLEDCPCDEEGACLGDLLCDDEDTEDDAPGTCRPPLACAGLGCVDNQLCEESEPGIDARCLEACAEGFVFNADTGQCDVFVPPNCDNGAQSSILVDCTAQNRACVEDGDTASCGGCLTDFIEEGGSCRAAITCVVLDCAADNRDCTPHTDQSDAVCAGCSMGFQEEDQACVPIPQINCQPDTPLSILADCTAQNRACVEDGDTASCGGCLDGFGFDEVLDACVQRLCQDLGCGEVGRECDGEPLAECGGCLEGLLPNDPDDIEQGCRRPLTCLDITCDDGEFCAQNEGQDAVCTEWPCIGSDNLPDFGRVLRQDTNECVSCELNCDEEGETGRIWPFTLERSFQCICETEEDFYFDEGLRQAAPCDSDGDNWVRGAARAFIESDDPALSDNARCSLQTIDRFVLENEWRQTFDVLSCVEGIVGAFDCQTDGDCEVGRCNQETLKCDCVEPLLIDLYESSRNDDQEELDDANNFDVPVYAADGRGRRLTAAELNPLTRACISATADLNDNGVTDLTEHHGLEPVAFDGETPEELSVRATFIRFGYFVELTEGFFDFPLDAQHGQYRIREKSRCDPSFPVQYRTDADPGPYSASCTRNRDVDFDRTGDNVYIGYEFAEWGCDAPAGTCTMPPPATDQTGDGEIPPHGLCEEGVQLPPVDGVWRGMNHHSQFKCLQLVDQVPDDRDAAAPHQRALGDILGGVGGLSPFQMNACRVACPDGDDGCALDCQDGVCATSTVDIEDNPDRPIIACSPLFRGSFEVGDIGFAAVRYNNAPANYTRGCIDEFDPSASEAQATPWKSLCPGFVQNPRGVEGQANPGNFGKLVCGCGFNYRGANCDIGCAGDELHFGGTNTGDACSNGYCPVSVDGEDGGRRGFWMCGELSTTSYEQLEEGTNVLVGDGGWSMDGELAPNGVDKAPLCQDGEDCASGWSIR